MTETGQRRNELGEPILKPKHEQKPHHLARWEQGLIQCKVCLAYWYEDDAIKQARADERAKLEKKFEFERKQMVDWGEANTKLQVEQARADVLKMVYEKAYKLDWSEDAFVIWLEAEIKEIK